MTLGLSATIQHNLNSMPSSISDLKSTEKESAFVRKIAVKDADQHTLKGNIIWLDENQTESLLQTKAVDTFLKDTKYLNYAVSTAAFIAFLSVAYICGMTEVKKSTRTTTTKPSSTTSHCENSCWYHPWWWNHHGYCYHCHCYDCCCSSSGAHSDFNSITLENISNKVMPVLVSIENKSQKDILLPIGSYLEGLQTFVFNPKDILKKYPNLSSKKCNLWFTYTMSMLLGL